MDGWEAESDVSRLIQGLGLSEDILYSEMSTLTAKEKVKVLLAQALFGLSLIHISIFSAAVSSSRCCSRRCRTRSRSHSRSYCRRGRSRCHSSSRSARR